MKSEKEIKEKWIWMMDYCKKNGYPPAHNWFWNKAEEAYNEYKKEVLEND